MRLRISSSPAQDKTTDVQTCKDRALPLRPACWEVGLDDLRLGADQLDCGHLAAIRRCSGEVVPRCRARVQEAGSRIAARIRRDRDVGYAGQSDRGGTES